MARFSIVIPTFNSGTYIHECVNSVLAQTVTDFEILIVDSGSTDTAFLDWLKGLNDARIQFYIPDARVAIEQNWARFTGLPLNEFMTILGHDDVLLPDYLEEMSRLIDTYKDASLYQTAYTYIDKNGDKIRDSLPLQEKMPGATLLEYVFKGLIQINATGYMMRSADYKSVGGIPLYPNLLLADVALWTMLAGKSYMAVSASKTFCYREHDSVSSTSADVIYHEAMRLFVNFLNSLKNKSAAYNRVIEAYGPAYLALYCRNFSHRLLKRTMEQRRYFTVKALIKDCDTFIHTLNAGASFKPFSNKDIVLAYLIDSNALSRNLFLLFKKTGITVAGGK